MTGIQSDTKFTEWVHRGLMAEEVISRYQRSKEVEDLRVHSEELSQHYRTDHQELSNKEHNDLINLSQRAQVEIGDERGAG